jgi:hypothetical protein
LESIGEAEEETAQTVDGMRYAVTFANYWMGNTFSDATNR